MKLLAFTDIHGSFKALKEIEQKVKTENPDLLVCAGDISMFENNINILFKRINSYNKPVIIVHGNHESEEAFNNINSRFKNIFYIHNSFYIYKDFLFIGYGGGGFSIEDLEFKAISINLELIIKYNKNKKIVLVAHGPPYKTKLDKINGSYSGSRPLRKFIENNKIDLVVCGHLHENFGKEDFIGKTIIVNPGPFGKIVEI